MNPSKIWIEQCEAARGIETEFGTQKALAYLIGEKFINFLEAAEDDPEFRAEIPGFVAEIKTIFERIDLSDQLTIKSNATGRVNIRCSHPDVPTGPKNIVHKAVRLIQQECGIDRGADIVIKKRIPVAAGLAGGSTNAASTLLGSIFT